MRRSLNSSWRQWKEDHGQVCISERVLTAVEKANRGKRVVWDWGEKKERKTLVHLKQNSSSILTFQSNLAFYAVRDRETFLWNEPYEISHVYTQPQLFATLLCFWNMHWKKGLDSQIMSWDARRMDSKQTTKDSSRNRREFGLGRVTKPDVQVLNWGGRKVPRYNWI